MVRYRPSHASASVPPSSGRRRRRDPLAQRPRQVGDQVRRHAVVREPLRYLHPFTDGSKVTSQLVNNDATTSAASDLVLHSGDEGGSQETVPSTNIAAGHRPVPARDAGRPRKSTAPATAPSEQGRRRVLASICRPPARAAAACVWWTGVERGGSPRRPSSYTGAAGEEDRGGSAPDGFRTRHKCRELLLSSASLAAATG